MIDPTSLNDSLGAAGSIASLIGLPLTLIQWWQSLDVTAKQTHTKDVDESLTQYLEWLRRQDHQELIERLGSVGKLDISKSIADISR